LKDEKNDVLLNHVAVIMDVETRQGQPSTIMLESTATPGGHVGRLTTEAPGDDYSGTMPEFLPAAQVRALSRVNAWASNAFIAAEYASIALAAAVCERLWSLPIYFLAVMFIASRQHALGNLAHDAAHYRLYRSKALNDWVGDVLLARPLWLMLQPYRKGHFAHHKHFLNPADPHLPRTPMQPVPTHRLALRFLFNISGVEGARYLILLFLSMRRRAQVAFVAFWLAIIVATAMGVAVTRLWLLYWFVPNFTWLMVASDLRFLSEHWLDKRVDYRDPYSVFYGSRIIEPTWFERVFVIRKNVHLHLDHHLYPSVPSHRLPRLHRMLLEHPEYRARIHVTRGYLTGVVREMLGRDRPVPDSERERAARHRLPLYSWTHSASFFAGFGRHEEINS
jgi:fatty acid desaturase